MDIIANFQYYIDADFFKIVENASAIRLEETKGIPYAVNIRINSEKNKFLIIDNLEVLKTKKSLYLKNYPNDCDYIILDLVRRIVYFIELKNTPTTNAEFTEQLKAGAHWLAHLLFCSRCEEHLKDWHYINVGIQYQNKRPSNSRKPINIQKNNFKNKHLGDLQYLKDICGIPLVVFIGQEISLDALRYDV